MTNTSPAFPFVRDTTLVSTHSLLMHVVLYVVWCMQYTIDMDDGEDYHGKLADFYDNIPPNFKFGDQFKYMLTGTRYVWGLSIPALFFIMCGLGGVAYFKYTRGRDTSVHSFSRFAIGGLALIFLGIFFLILALILYNRQVYVGWSFLVVLLSGLLAVLSLLLQISLYMSPGSVCAITFKLYSHRGLSSSYLTLPIL